MTIKRLIGTDADQLPRNADLGSMAFQNSEGFSVGTLQVTSGASLPLGALTTPSLYFIGDTNTGIYSPGADQISFVTNGTAKVILTSSGVTLGATNFTGDLTLNNNNLTNANRLTFADPGPNEGVVWAGGNGWAVYESPNDLATNTAGNLQIAIGTTTRVATFATTGLDLSGTSGAARLSFNGKSLVSPLTDSVASWEPAGQTLSGLGNMSEINFKPDGTKAYITRSSDILQYTLSTPWDLTTAVAGTAFTFTHDSAVGGFTFSPDGTKIITVGSTAIVNALPGVVASEDRAFTLPLGTAWDTSTITLVGATTLRFAISDAGLPAAETGPSGIRFNPAGTIMYMLGSTGDALYQYSLTSAYDVSTATYVKQLALASVDTSALSLEINSDGTRMYILGSSGDDINEFRLGTAYDIATAVFYDKFYVGFYELTPQGLYISDANNVAFIGGSTSDIMQKFITNKQAIDIQGETATTLTTFAGKIDLDAENVRVKNGNLTVEKQAYVASTLTVDGVSNLNSTVVVGGDITVGGNDVLVGSATANASLFSGITTGTLSIGTSQTTGAINIGGTAATGNIVVGQSTGAQVLWLGTGATISGTTKTINLGTTGVSGSITNVNIGSAVSGALGTTTISGTAINVATTSATAVTTTIGPAVTANILKVGSTAAGTVSLTTDVTTGIANVFTSLTTGTLNLGTGGASTTNIGGAAAVLNVGTTAGDSILEVRGNATTGTATIRTNTGVVTANVFNTVATTLNIGGAATTIGIGAAGGTVTIAGNLTVNGTTTTVNSTTISVDDKNIELGSVASPTDTTADGGGITLLGDTNKTINWVNATDAWTSSENLDLASGKTFMINGVTVLSATALADAVIIDGGTY